jgi:DNA-binding MarR family transcriptional regulator
LSRRLAAGAPVRIAVDLMRLWTLLSERYNADMAKSKYKDVRMSYGQLFGYIEDEGMTLTHLADRAGISKQAMAELVDRLEDLGYVERTPDPRDGRAKLIRTTDKGERQIEVARKTLRAIERRWAKFLGEARLEQLKATLQELAAIEARERENA